MIATGAKPPGARDESSAAQGVRDMFDTIAPRYDLLNHVLSANVDRLWWWRAARRFRAVLADPEASVLDICCGTGDMTLALLKRRPRCAQPILAADFSRQMLHRGARKFGRNRDGGLEDSAPYAIALEADALHLPLRAESLDLIVTAFGFRNLANYEAGLKEFHRALKPGGQLGILDFSLPDGLVGKAYRVYFDHVLPVIGRMVCGRQDAYRYLPASVGSFPPPEELKALMRACGFGECAWTPYTFGIAGLYTGTRPGRTTE